MNPRWKGSPGFSTRHSHCPRQYTVHSTQYTVHSTEYTVHSTQYTERSTQYAVRSTQYAVHMQYTGTGVEVNP